MFKLFLNLSFLFISLNTFSQTEVILFESEKIVECETKYTTTKTGQKDCYFTESPKHTSRYTKQKVFKNSIMGNLWFNNSFKKSLKEIGIDTNFHGTVLKELSQFEIAETELCSYYGTIYVINEYKVPSKKLPNALVNRKIITFTSND